MSVVGLWRSRQGEAEMNRQHVVGVVVAAIGIVLVVVAAAADSIGVGDGGGFGNKQAVGVVVGAIGVALGAWLLYRSRQESVSES